MKNAKQISNPKNQRWFKSSRTEAQPLLKVDREKGIIHDVVLAQAGPAKGHGTICEMPFISKIVEEGMKMSAGVKVHFGHPSMSEETLGAFTGRAFNHRLKGNQAIADIHLSQTAIKSPKGDLYNYLLGLAESEPDIFGMSVVTSGNRYHQKDENGEYVEITWDDEGNSNYDSSKEVFETFEALCGVDFVDEGALTPNGLFSSFSIDFNKDKFAVIVTDFLNINPNVDEFVKSNPEKLIEFMSKRYDKNFSIKEHKSLFQRVRDIFSSNPDSKSTIIKYMNQFDINATTSEGVAITIISESQDTPAVGDAVVLTESGDPAPDGEHMIAADSPALAGYTITVEGGVISNIVEPSAEGDTSQQSSEGGNPPAGDTVESLKAALVEQKKKYAALEAKMKKFGNGEFTPVFNNGRTPGGTEEPLSPNQKAAREAQEKAKKTAKKE